MGKDNSFKADTIEPKVDSIKMHMTKRAKQRLIAIITVGILLSLLAFGITQYVEQRYIHTDFEHAGEMVLRTINGSLESIHLDLQYIAAFYDGSVSVERARPEGDRGVPVAERCGCEGGRALGHVLWKQ